MKNKRNFNNLIDSVCLTLVLFLTISIYIPMIIWGVINPREGTDPIATLIVATILFGGMIIVSAIIIVKDCYGYWILSDNSIYFKKLFSRSVVIKFDEIKKVEKKSLMQLLQYAPEAYIVYSSTEKIVVIFNKKNRADLDSILAPHISQ